VRAAMMAPVMSRAGSNRNRFMPRQHEPIPSYCRRLLPTDLKMPASHGAAVRRFMKS
jgi:hypothetical protein